MKMRYPDPEQQTAEEVPAPAEWDPFADLFDEPLDEDEVEQIKRDRLRRRRLAFLFPLLLIIIDATMIAAAFFLAYRLRRIIEFPPPINIPPLQAYIGMLGIQVGALLLTYFFNQMYQRKRSRSHIDEMSKVITATSVGVVLTLAATSFFYKNSLDYPRLMVVYAWALTIVFVTAGRLLHARLQWMLQARDFAREHVVVVGAGETADIVLKAIERSPELGYRVVGLVTVNGYPVNQTLPAPMLGTTDDLPKLIDRHGIDEVIIATPEASHREMVHIIGKCEREKVTIKVFPDLFQFMAGEMGISDLNGLPLLTVRDIALRGWKLGVKRLIDFALSAAALILLSPLMLLIAVLIKLDSRGPVFYTQERMGLDAKSFHMLKFRSMEQGAEEDGPGWTTEDDPRRTRIGTFLRSLSLDELPQLINVLFGEMSLVGPRPERPVYVEQFRRFIPRYMDRHREKAGITGWAQVNGLRGDTSIAERTKYDLWYIENWSLVLDFKIMIKTMWRVITDRNAY